MKKLCLGDAITLIAQLGGYLNRKCDGPAGFETLWKGYARFYDMVDVFRLQQPTEVENR